MARRIAFAIFRWFLGRRPVSLECFIRPVSVMYSDIMVKFCAVSAEPSSLSAVRTYLVFGNGVDPEGVEGVARGRLAGELPLLLLHGRQIVRCVDVARVPPAVDLLLEGLSFLARLQEDSLAVGAALEGHCAHAHRKPGVSGRLGWRRERLVGGEAVRGAAAQDIQQVGSCSGISGGPGQTRGRSPFWRPAVVAIPRVVVRDAATAERNGIRMRDMVVNERGRPGLRVAMFARRGSESYRTALVAWHIYHFTARQPSSRRASQPAPWRSVAALSCTILSSPLFPWKLR